VNKNKGMTLVEKLAAAAILLFLFFMAFYTLGNILSGAILAEKKVQLIDELDKRVNAYELDSSFDTSTSEDMSFSEVNANNEIIDFTATNSNFSLSIVKRAFKQA
jgi:type II secretory pathway pseudopilin PulG